MYPNRDSADTKTEGMQVEYKYSSQNLNPVQGSEV
jgi:hypothetical protein